MGKEAEEAVLQWHPAFFAGIQIEFGEEREKLTFENEHQLGTKPKQIDVLIIKKESETKLRKNIGKIFRRYNIIEYKSPKDYLSIDDFYQVYGYACFFKADTEQANKILGKYEGHQKENLYKSVMNMIVNANREVFKEANKMCEALLDLMKEELEDLIKDELEERERAGRIAGERAGRIAGERAGRIAGERAGRIAGEKAGKIAGERNLKIHLIQTKLSKGKNVEAIAEELEETVENVLELMKEIK